MNLVGDCAMTPFEKQLMSVRSAGVPAAQHCTLVLHISVPTLVATAQAYYLSGKAFQQIITSLTNKNLSSSHTGMCHRNWVNLTTRHLYTKNKESKSQLNKWLQSDSDEPKTLNQYNENILLKGTGKTTAAAKRPQSDERPA